MTKYQITSLLNRRTFLKSALATVATYPMLRFATEYTGHSASIHWDPDEPQEDQKSVWAWLRMFPLEGEYLVPTSEEMYKAHLDQIDVAMPTNGGVLREDGSWLQERWKIIPHWPQSLPEIARDAGHLYVPTVINQRGESTYTVLENPKLQAIAAEQLVALATTERFDAPWDGVCLDLESIPFSFKEQLSDFLYLLVEKIREAGLLVVISVGGRTADELGDGYDYAVVRELADYVDMRCYGYREPPPRSISPYWWIEECIQFALEMGIDRERLVLGLGNFSKYWPDSTRNFPVIELPYAEALRLVKEAGSSIEWIERNENGLVREHYAPIGDGHIWIHDAESYQDGLNLIDQYRLHGNSMFAVGMGNQAQWDVVKEWRSQKLYLPSIHRNSVQGTIPGTIPQNKP
jgi:spore germination protein YaaH